MGSKVCRISSHESCIHYGSVGSTIYEGGDQLQFELCQPGRVYGTNIVATCQVPIEAVLENLRGNRSMKTLANLEMSSESGKQMASLTLDICIRSSILKDAGGGEALKTIRVPRKPLGYSAFAFDDYARDCRTFLQNMLAAHDTLRSALALSAAAAAWKQSRTSTRSYRHMIGDDVISAHSAGTTCAL